MHRDASEVNDTCAGDQTVAKIVGQMRSGVHAKSEKLHSKHQSIATCCMICKPRKQNNA